MLKWTFIAAAALVAFVVAMLLVLGAFLGADQIHVSTEIARSPHQIWPWIDNGDKLKQWVSGLVDVTQSTWVMKEMTLNVRRTEVVPESRLAVALSSPNQFEGTESYTLTDLGNGKTRLDIDAHYRFMQWFAHLMTPLVMPAARNKLASDAERLKSLIETPTR